MGLQSNRAFAALLAVSMIVGCQPKKAAPTQIGTAKVERRDIIVDATATGAVEPIEIVEVKSKAGGQITKMSVETGSQVKAGDLLVQIDTRDVKNQYEQAQADVRSAQSQLDVATAQKKRADELYKTRVITTTEYETATLQLTSAQSSIVRANTNLDLAKQRLEDATVVAPLSGTVIERPVSEGMVIASATGSVSGGTTLLKMADLSKVQMRVLVNETDIGNIRADQTARVIVDAYPDRPFAGVVEKIEPQAIVQQSVTMFPVIVSLRNDEGYLKPGMNGEVSVMIEQRNKVIAVPNDAVRTLREAGTAALLVGLIPDSVQAYVRAQQALMGGGRGRGAGAPTDAPATQSVDATGKGNGGAGGAQKGDSSARGGRGGNRAGRGDSTAARGGRGGMGGGMGRGMRGDSTRMAMGGGGGANGGRRGGRGGNGGGGQGGQGGGKGGQMSNAMSGGPRIAPRTRSGLVFVQTATGFEPRVVRLGPSNYDYSEVLSGLNEGETVATLAVAALQAKRDAANDRLRAQQGGGVPGMSRGAPAGGGAPGGGGAGGRGGGRQ